MKVTSELYAFEPLFEQWLVTILKLFFRITIFSGKNSSIIIIITSLITWGFIEVFFRIGLIHEKIGLGFENFLRGGDE